MDEFEWAKSFPTSNYGTIREHTTTRRTHGTQAPVSRGSFASFVCHVSNLEKKLRSLSPIVLDGSSSVESGKILGQGKTFMVRHARWTRDPKEPPLDVALKEIIPDIDVSEHSSRSSGSSHRVHSDWKDILFELRVLLHEPIRYHPNIIRLLGIQWGLSPISESTYPVLLMEYASLGTFKTLQSSQGTLSFSLKQKLCYDVGRGLLALHACGIVHGDMKHENVLIFQKSDTADGYEYTAKLADFGGTIMDMTADELRGLETWTWPFNAPEVSSGQPLTKSQMKLTDVYSFGLLVWRAFEDGDGFVDIKGAAQVASDEDKRNLVALKASDEILSIAMDNMEAYAGAQEASKEVLDMFVYVVRNTVRRSSEHRDLVKAQAALRGIRPAGIEKYLEFVREKNGELAAVEASRIPGQHGITPDSISMYLGRSGKAVDLQGNLPGYRPILPHPNPEEFSFEPETMKHVLTWDQQQQMLEEMKEAAESDARESGGLLGLKKTVAAFYVFQCYLLEFGTTFQASEAVMWLGKACSDDNSHEDEDYLSQAWVWRLSKALAQTPPITTERLEILLKLSVMRGHRNCLQDINDLISVTTGTEQQKWRETYGQARGILLRQMGAVGMGYYYTSFMTPPWNRVRLEDLDQLDACIRTALGNNYEFCLKQGPLTDAPIKSDEGRVKTAFDKIYINQRGHGLLHYAAASGSIRALRHMIAKYHCNHDIPNQHVDETPLVCACESGNLDCALFLLEQGADPNGYHYGQEAPLHWLSSFATGDMDKIAKALITAGADIELRSRSMRHDVRGIRADWEHIFGISTTPLGRAVLLNNADAVRVLLKLGANPLTKSANKHRGEWEGMTGMSRLMDVASPFELAAILTYPEMLAMFIRHIDGENSTPKLRLVNEADVLDLARGKKLTEFDPFSLQSRLVRCGSRYQSNMTTTLMLLCARDFPFVGNYSEAIREKRAEVLCREVKLGNVDIVNSLLSLRYDANGTEDYRPIEEAIKSNHGAMFDALKRNRADLLVTRTTPTGAISLLHTCASRPRQSRPGRTIADALIHGGVPVESVDKRSKPPLAFAILHQNFDVASALIENGANVDALYPLFTSINNGPEPQVVSVLVEILSQHTMRTIESLKFLFGKREGGPQKRPAFHIDAANKLSIFHLLAGSPNFTEIAQITPKILNLCLETYREPELINYRHQLVGSALYYAATKGHKAMVERLLQYGADESVGAGPVMRDSVETLLRPRSSWTPLWATILRLDSELRYGQFGAAEEGPHDWISSKFIRDLEKCIAFLLENNKDPLAKEAVEQLLKKKQSLEEKARHGRTERAGRRGKGNQEEVQAEQPANLRVLSEPSREADEQKIEKICAEP